MNERTVRRNYVGPAVGDLEYLVLIHDRQRCHLWL
jgi:hypothetical protein